MNIHDLIQLRNYSDVREGDLYYESEKGFLPVTNVGREDFTYRFSPQEYGSLGGQDRLKDVILFRVEGFGAIALFAGENIVNILRKVSQDRMPRK